MSLKGRLAKLDKLIKLLPNQLEVSSSSVGAAHRKEEAAVEQTTELKDKLASALSGATVGPEITGVLGDAAEYEKNHQEMLSYIAAGGGGGPSAPSAPPPAMHMPPAQPAALPAPAPARTGGSHPERRPGCRRGQPPLWRHRGADPLLDAAAGAARRETACQ